ncbi:hypothetical protein K474DRAFT_1660246 [Panus rudis PR-1116 ss-1]|nr:hypothetical protein K474DRAFT_1660246 [Panus rudis PR-1116 ss-1]
MKSFFVLAALVASAFAQGISIGSPAPHTEVTGGETITVEIDRPDTISGAEDVFVAIGVQQCNGGCDKAPFIFGQIVAKGDFNPQRDSDPTKPPHQNFTVTLPSITTDDTGIGEIRLSVAHLALVGASLFPTVDTANITLNVVPPNVVGHGADGS